MHGIFDHRDYKAYLRETLKREGRGSQGRMADAISCQSGFLSQVLNGSAHLSLEQGENLNRYLHHANLESRFFLHLISWGRAGSMDLKKRWEQEIESILHQRLNLKDRFDIKKVLDPEAQAIYYSAWYYAAIHVAVSVPTLRTENKIAGYFQLEPARVREVLDWLTSVGLVEKKSDGYRQGVTRLFLGKDSGWISKHHANWRFQAVQSLDRADNSENTHFSAVVSLSRKDFMQIQEALVRAIDEARGRIRTSPEEIVGCLNLDFFKLGKS